MATYFQGYAPNPTFVRCVPKQELEKRLSQESDKVKTYQVEIAALQGALDQQREATDAHRIELSRESTSTR